MVMAMVTQTLTQQVSMALFGLLQTVRMHAIPSRLTRTSIETVVLMRMEMGLPIPTPQASMAQYGQLQTVRMHSLAMPHNGTIRTTMGTETTLYQLLKEMHVTQHSEHPIKTDLGALIPTAMVTQTPTQQAFMVLYGLLQTVRMRSRASRANGRTKMVTDMATMRVVLTLTIVLQRLEHQPNSAILDAVISTMMDTLIPMMHSLTIQHSGAIQMVTDSVMKARERIPMLARPLLEPQP